MASLAILLGLAAAGGAQAARPMAGSVPLLTERAAPADLPADLLQGAVPADGELEGKFQAWARLHGRGYLSSNGLDYGQRLATFKANYAKVLAHNNKQAAVDGWWMGAEGPWMDLTHEEFVKTLGTMPAKEASGLPFTHADVEALDSVDWTKSKKPVVTPVKNQGMCGSCWAFSTTGSVEGAHALATGELVSLSEQELVDCDHYGDQGCSGGLMDQAFTYVKAKGLVSEKRYGYKGYNEKCQDDAITNPDVTIDGHVDVPSGDEVALRKAITAQPVSVAVDATLWQFYLGGVFNGIFGHCGGTLDHGVLAVGYHVDKSKTAKKSWYKIKNSWGGHWGEKGFIRLRMNYGKYGMCAVAKAASYPVINSPPQPPQN